MSFTSRLLYSLCTMSLIATLAYGQESFPERMPPLNTVKLQLSAEEWATTQSAKVTIAINASLNEGQLAKMYNDIQLHLKKLSDKADWHITAFNRSQDQSGLERVDAQAEARLPQTELAGLRDKAKALSKPGNTLTVQDIEFSPSLREMDAVKMRLRENIYQQARTELEALNKAYPDQHYFLHSVNFLPPDIGPVPMQRTMMSGAAAVSEQASMSPMAVNNKMSVTATVTLASRPERQM